jgi:hypothetical protein
MIVSLLPVVMPRIDLESAASAAGVHPDVVERFVDLGLITATTDAAGRLWLARGMPERIRRIVRLHADLGLNYAAIALVLDLLGRIDDLEGERWIIRSRKDGSSWT